MPHKVESGSITLSRLPVASQAPDALSVSRHLGAFLSWPVWVLSEGQFAFGFSALDLLQSLEILYINLGDLSGGNLGVLITTLSLFKPSDGNLSIAWANSHCVV